MPKGRYGKAGKKRKISGRKTARKRKKGGSKKTKVGEWGTTKMGTRK